MIEQITKRESEGKKPYEREHQPFFKVGRTATMYLRVLMQPVEKLAEYSEKINRSPLPYGVFEVFTKNDKIIGVVYDRDYITEQKVLSWAEKSFKA